MSGTSEQQYYDDLRASTQQHVDAANFWRGESGRHEAAREQMLTHVSDATARLHDFETHVRLSKNIILEPSTDGLFPNHWAMGLVYWAAIEDFVQNGIVTSQRSVLANEFLAAIKSNSMSFGSSFWIWRMKAKIPAGATYAHLFYQWTNTSSGESTAGCVFKHISGLVPGRNILNGATANSSAKLLLARNINWNGGRHHSYSMLHGGISGNAGEESEFLIALPAIVTGYVPENAGWGLFPYLNQSEV